MAGAPTAAHRGRCTHGALTVFTKDSGVELTDAVTASCAVPGVWPPVTINGRGYIDGGVRSGSNADSRKAVTGCSSSPRPAWWAGALREPHRGRRGAQANSVEVIYADDASVAAFGTNPLSPATRGPPPCGAPRRYSRSGEGRRPLALRSAAASDGYRSGYGMAGDERICATATSSISAPSETRASRIRK